MAVAESGQLNLETVFGGSRTIDSFQKLQQIGQGTYAQVYTAKDIITGEIVALKKIRMENEKNGFPITALREIRILSKLHHENIIKLKEILASPGANLLIDNKGTLKLADFGLSRYFPIDEKGNLTNRVITLWYRPPELLLGSTKYGPAVDMWSVGCIFAELLDGKALFPGRDEAEQIYKIFELCGAPDESCWPGVTKLPWYDNLKPNRPMKRRLREHLRHLDHHALDLLEKMLILDPAQV
ncbi:hypothetical protein BVRB_012670 [Beta vulgaris subsp. vulgaris]|uniref:cyclin-dependent kinase n=1 Tax=Beta vulgaris subsp. vulgaris TaxID=3555 RepID=A0A0J8B5C8_BETVV|nr:hypothetical protein BVRB_012670 [Beta vulgaris subsp. vulgaris]